MTHTRQRLTHTLPDLVAVHERAGITIAPVPWPEGYDADDNWRAHRAVDVPTETQAGYAAVFATFDDGSRVIVPWRFSLRCKTNDAIPRVTEALGLDVVQRLAFAVGLVIAKPRAGQRAAGSPMDIVDRVNGAAHPDVNAIELVWLQLLGPRS